MGQLTQTFTEVQSAIDKAQGIGWENCGDSTYTAGSPLSIASTRTKLTIDGLGATTNTAYLPDDVNAFWDTTANQIEPERVGDAFDSRLVFKAKASAQNAYFDVQFDIGGAVGVVASQTLVAPKAANAEIDYVVDLPLFALSTFLSNGCEIYIDTSDAAITLSVYDIGLMVKRDYTKKV